MQIFLLTTHFGLRPYGQPGQLPKATEMLPLLIELKAQFYKLVLCTVGTAPCGTMHQLVKRSIKSSKSKYLLYRLCIKRKSAAGAMGQRCGEQTRVLRASLRRKGRGSCARSFKERFAGNVWIRTLPAFFVCAAEYRPPGW